LNLCGKVRCVGVHLGNDLMVVVEFRRNGVLSKVRAQKTQSKDACVNGKVACTLDDQRVVSPDEIEQTEERPVSVCCILRGDRERERSAGGADGHSTCDERIDVLRALLRTVLIDGAPRPPLGDGVFSHALLSGWVKNPKPELAGMYDDAQAGISRWNRVVCSVDLDVPIEMGTSLEDSVVFEACRRQR
jgi:hypothetical protein